MGFWILKTSQMRFPGQFNTKIKSSLDGHLGTFCENLSGIHPEFFELFCI